MGRAYPWFPEKMTWDPSRKRAKKTVYLGNNNSRLLPLVSYYPEDFRNTTYTMAVAHALLNWSIEEKEGERQEEIRLESND